MQLIHKKAFLLHALEAEKQQDNMLTSTKSKYTTTSIHLSCLRTTKMFALVVMCAALTITEAQENLTSSTANLKIDISSSLNISLPKIETVNPLGYIPIGRIEDNSTKEETATPSTGLSFLIGFICLFTILGNLIVILSIAIFRKLRKIPNMFIVSLASADLTMGGIVLPLGSHYVVGSKWLLGNFACDLWTSIDILSVTASICTLCAISLDRFVAITMPFQYSTKMTKNRARFIIAFIWILSTTIAFVPINLGWWKTDNPDDIKCYNDPHCCEFRINRTYAVVSSLISFYIPLFVMIFAYTIVFKIAIQKRTKIQNREGVFRRASMPGSRSLLWGRGEYRAVFTMGIIMGTFIMCWLPFFIANIVQVFCDRCISSTTFVVLNWFGYVNSFFNPIIYCHSKQFRRAFKRILLCSLCRDGYQQTSRASLSVSYTPSFSLRSSANADSSIFQLSRLFRSNSNASRRASRLSAECKKCKKPSPVNGYMSPTNPISRLSNGNVNGAALYGQRSNRFDDGEADEGSYNSCGSEVSSANQSASPDRIADATSEADNRQCQDDDGQLLDNVPFRHHQSRVKDGRSKSTSAHREEATCKHVIFKTASHNDICERKLNENLCLPLPGSTERSSSLSSSIETTMDECNEVNMLLLQDDPCLETTANTTATAELFSSAL